MLALVVATPALAAETGRYAFVGATPEEGIGTFLDRGGVVRDGDVARADYLAILRRTSGEDVDYGVIRMAVNCADRSGRGLGGVTYRADGGVVREEDRADESWRPARDDLERAAFAAACDSAVPQGAPAFDAIPAALRWFRGQDR